jgi:hypothetical protein
VFGKRVYLCKRHTKEEAGLHEKEFYDLCMSEFYALKTVSGGLTQTVV